MAKTKETVEWCDNPKCDYSELIISGETSIGYHFGKGYWLLAGGGPIPAFYAHTEECVVPAMMAVIR